MQKSKNKKNDFSKLKANSYKLKATAGFTLIETLVAIAVLVLSVTAPLEIAAKALFSAFHARNQITAYYLASEAIEYIKNARDTTFLNDVLNEARPIQDNQDWLLGLENCKRTSGGNEECYIDTTVPFDPYASALSNEAVKSCPADIGGDVVCPKLQYNPDTGLWGYDAIGNVTQAPETKFTRKIYIPPQSNNGGSQDEVLIKATIEWAGANPLQATQSFTLVGSMMNWERK